MDLRSLLAISKGTQAERVEALRSLLGYPIKERDVSGSKYWYLRPGVNSAEAEDTCPIAVGFYAECDRLSKSEIKAFFTDQVQQQETYGHYTNQIAAQQPVMYLLLPEGEQMGRVTFVLPIEGGIRQRQVESFGWDKQELLGRLSRLQQGQLPIAARALVSIPLVEWVFYEAAHTAKELAQLLAEVTRRMEQALPLAYEAEGVDGYLHNLLESFQRELLPNLKLKAENEKDYSFADIYAQTIAYGLFTARVFSHVHDPKADFNRQGAWQQLPETNPFLRKLFQDVSERSLEELGDELVESIAEVFGILRAAKMDAILSDFRQKMNREDIVIRFYEDFLAAYKPKMREGRGVYYTPEPVVSYMVRCVDILLKEKFNKPLGLADPEVMILDPACGTGTFLLWIFKLIEERFKNDGEARSLIKQKLGNISWSNYVKDNLLPRVFGFELLMAPYAICHLKLGLFLEESGYAFDSDQRLGVYLTNTLDDAKRQSESLFKEFIAEESNEAAGVKLDIPVMVVIGNPPYSGHSENKSEWVGSLVKDYYFVDGLPLGEKNPKWLQDDYVKFIRFSQWRIDKTGKGILSFVTNHGYLDNPTFRGMRQSLAKSFNWIRILDLHGNSKKKETAIDGTKDENVFDIQQGVAVCMMAKEVNP
ncbi:putative helicase [Synechococcus sp. PCC 7502]|uniref:N-6 DNA methylase n=1 Tax=Synechococcus sp. PCC 7502 TaxID=1173263 RepID=UPI00029FFD96|nr:N-6 DNA methylase [Synechococcus sp. PCC 7502]AFY73273.1 putative helicase [Synechococcus sp. PCC 7502]